MEVYGYIALALGLLGVAFGMHMHNVQEALWGRSFAALSCLATVCAAGFIVWMHVSVGSRLHSKVARVESMYRQAAMVYLASYLKFNHDGQHVMLITPPRTAANSYDIQQLVDKFEKSLGSAVPLMATIAPEIPAEATAKTEEISHALIRGYWQAKDLDAAFEENGWACNLIVSLVGLPADASDLKLMRKKVNRPKLILFVDSLRNMHLAIRDRLVDAVIFYNPDHLVDYEKPVPKDPREAFEYRYILIDSSNVRECWRKYPGLFRATHRD